MEFVKLAEEQRQERPGHKHRLVGLQGQVEPLHDQGRREGAQRAAARCQENVPGHLLAQSAAHKGGCKRPGRATAKE